MIRNDLPNAADLSPAKWIWLPSGRTLANTFVLFRYEFHLDEPPTSAKGWLTADSRYLLTINGKRVQWGPAPADPRSWDVDPFDITEHLQIGENVIGVEVLFYGHGDGTWPIGKPGFLFKMEVKQHDGQTATIISDGSWKCMLDRAHKPGQYRRWYLRALQEEFDARLHPYGWNESGYVPGAEWIPAMEIGSMADKPPMCAWYGDYINATEPVDPVAASLYERQIPLLLNVPIPASRLADSGRVIWKRDPSDWFDYRMPDCFEIVREPIADESRSNEWILRKPNVSAGYFFTFEFEDQIVGWPGFTIDAPEGTVIELMVQESHDVSASAWMDNHLFAWSRFICREGTNRFEAFDYESFKWMQLHIRNTSGPVKISDAGVRRRIYDWPNEPVLQCSEPGLQRLFDASINTLHNSAQDTVMDGAGRERQQYSGDAAHQLHAIYMAFGETQLPARFIRTFSEGICFEGYFLDTWPAYDRLSRLSQRQIGATRWGPILDHSVQFVFDCWNHYMYTGNLNALKEAYPRLIRAADFFMDLRKSKGSNGLLPVENLELGMPSVYIDHEGYPKQRNKQCAFNLYTAAMYKHALVPLIKAFGDNELISKYMTESDEILDAAVDAFWSSEKRTFINNLLWIDEDGAPHYDDRSLANAIIYDQCPNGDTDESIRILAECPPDMGLSYPCNAGWRYWALVKLGRSDIIINDYRNRWATMSSVILNNTLQEFWHANPDTAEEWSHCCVIPVFVTMMGLAGIKPTAPGFTECEIKPQLGDLPDLEVIVYTVSGDIKFNADKISLGYNIAVSIPDGVKAKIVVPEGYSLSINTGCELPAGETQFDMIYTN
ncbi:MAG: alpha-L-rhamnosidase N-terminal domain-containing protein [Armatimonadota bacterium]